jgi:hypothetical protein
MEEKAQRLQPSDSFNYVCLIFAEELPVRANFPLTSKLQSWGLHQLTEIVTYIASISPTGTSKLSANSIHQSLIF